LVIVHLHFYFYLTSQNDVISSSKQTKAKVVFSTAVGMV